MPGALAFTYARALADVVTKPGSATNAQTVLAELTAFEKLLVESAELRIALESPAIPPARKRAVIERLAKALPISQVVERFLFVLMDHRRAALLHEILEAFESVVDERVGIARADVASARPLTEPQQQQIVAGIVRLTGKQARARFSVREDLIGGVVARIGSTVYDGSVRGRLDALGRRLAGVEK